MWDNDQKFGSRYPGSVLRVGQKGSGLGPKTKRGPKILKLFNYIIIIFVKKIIIFIYIIIFKVENIKNIFCQNNYNF